MPAILAHSPVRVLFAAGALRELGPALRSLGATRVLLVSDPALRAPGHLDVALASLAGAQVAATIHEAVPPNPSEADVVAGLDAARRQPIDAIVGLGGGSAMDCAKGVNLLLSCGGRIADYRGDPGPDVLAARRPLLPMVLVPTTAGTGSEAQSFALIRDSTTGMKLACGDRRPPAGGGLRPRVAILDPQLTRTQPPPVAAATGMDALTHAVETSGCRVRSETSRALSREAWVRLSRCFPTAVRDPNDDAARAEMLLGAHLAGCAIEASMLGAAHACANPLTARFEIVHGVAVGLMLPHVIRFNAAAGANPYADLDESAEHLAERIAGFGRTAGLPSRLRDLAVPQSALRELAPLAAAQWTASYNPRPVSSADIERIYHQAW